ncbi:hypothetical protein ABQE58_25080 [Mycolicibacterium elephantis]
MTAPWVALLEKVLRDSAALPHAFCRERPELFDPPAADTHPDDADYAERAALRLCRACPELNPCAAWVESLPKSKRPCGVVAGQVPAAPKQAAI